MELPSNRQTFRIYLVLVVVCAGLIQVESAVKIISPTENQIIKDRNQSVSFNCTITSASSSRANFQWFRNNTEFYPVNQNNSSNWSSFELKHFTAKDEGEYVCTNGGSDSVTVRLASKPNAKNIGERNPLTPTVDDDAKLQCEAVGWPKPTITWLKNNKSISEINQNHQYEENPIPSQGDSSSSVASELTIVTIQKKDGGIYTCQATNAVGKDEYNISVLVKDGQILYKTTITAEKLKYTAEVGKDAFLVCLGEQVKDDRKTWLSWEFNGTRLNASTRHYAITNSFSNQENGATPKVHMQLTIFNADYVDEGTYTCAVHSYQVKRASDNIKLEVKASEKRDKGMKVWMIVVLTVAFLLALALAVLMFAVWRRIKRKKRMAKLAQKYERDTHDYTFEHDVFVSYSSKDYEWIVQSLLPVFDNNDIKYIIHSRDFKPGKAFFDNMADSVYNSRKVILVMSVNYLCSGFCKDEMHMALYRSAERDDGSLIVVRIDNIKTKDIPTSLRHKTFIDFTSREEEATWQSRILESVRSENRSWRVASDDSTDGIGTSDRLQLIFSVFKPKKKERQNVSRELTDQA